jgi:hypothetical protein
MNNYVFTIIDLLVIVLISFIYVATFRIQKIISPSDYFGFQEIVYGVRKSIRPISIVIKFAVILFYSSLCFMAIKNGPNIIVGVTLGSFLIVWPNIMNPYNLDPKLVRKKMILYIWYIIFIISSGFIAHLGVLIILLLKNFISSNSINIMRLILESIIVAVLGWLLKYISKYLNKEISIDK